MNGKRHGPWHRYYDELDDGDLMIEGTYEMGEMDGCWKKYDEYGTLREVEFYEKGKKVGKWEFYDEDGVLEKTETH